MWSTEPRKRAALFETTADYEAFERLLAAAAGRIAVAVFAYCLMPNHWHLVASPKTDGALSRFMHWLTTTHARRWQLSRGTGGQGAVYQGRFRAIPVKDDRHFLWVCRYVERNPLRAAIVDHAEDWRWSSLGGAAQEGDLPWLAEWPVPRSPQWLANVNQPQTNAEVEAFRRAMRQGQPFGDGEWQAAIHARFGKTSSNPRGHPRATISSCPRKMTPDPITNR